MEATADLRANLQQLLPDGSAAVSDVVPITSLPSGNGRHASFRVEMADGSRYKLRRLADPAHVERLLALVPLVPKGSFSPAIAARGRLMLEGWVEGQDAAHVVSGGGQGLLELSEKCGEILGRLHAVGISRSLSYLVDAARIGAERRAADVEALLVGLATAALLERDDRDRLVALATARVPAGPDIGLVHRDLAPENVVVGADGMPVLVDNLTLKVEALDGDLARTWYRWPMDPSVRAAFDLGYERYRPTSGFDEYFEYWAIATLAEAATYRHKATTSGLDVPLARLRALGHGPRALLRSGPMPSSARTFGWGDQTFLVRSSSSDLLDHLDESICPWFEAQPGGAAHSASLVVDVMVDPRSEDSMAQLTAVSPDRHMDAFAMDSRIIRLPAWEIDGGLRLVDAELRVMFERRGRLVRIVSPREGAARVATMRVLREAATGRYVAGDRLAHVAGLAIGDDVWLIGGPKGAGKTTLLLHLLRAPGTAFLANDRVLLDEDRDRVIARGVPTIVSIKPGTIDLLGELGARIAASPYRHAKTIAEAETSPARGASGASLTPAQLLRITGTTPVRDAIVAAVLLPTVDDRVESFEARVMTRSEVRKRASALRFGPPGELSNGPFTDAAPLSGLKVMSTLQESVTWVELRIGRTGIRDDPAAILESVAGLLAATGP